MCACVYVCVCAHAQQDINTTCWSEIYKKYDIYKKSDIYKKQRSQIWCWLLGWRHLRQPKEHLPIQYSNDCGGCSPTDELDPGQIQPATCQDQTFLSFPVLTMLLNRGKQIWAYKQAVLAWWCPNFSLTKSKGWISLWAHCQSWPHPISKISS